MACHGESLRISCALPNATTLTPIFAYPTSMERTVWRGRVDMAVTDLEVKPAVPLHREPPLATSAPTNNWMALCTSLSTRTIPAMPGSLT